MKALYANNNRDQYQNNLNNATDALICYSHSLPYTPPLNDKQAMGIAKAIDYHISLDSGERRRITSATKIQQSWKKNRPAGVKVAPVPAPVPVFRKKNNIIITPPVSAERYTVGGLKPRMLPIPEEPSDSLLQLNIKRRTNNPQARQSNLSSASIQRPKRTRHGSALAIQQNRQETQEQQKSLNSYRR